MQPFKSVDTKIISQPNKKILPRYVFKKLQFSTGSPDWVYTVSNGKQHRFTKDLNSKTNE